MNAKDHAAEQAKRPIDERDSASPETDIRPRDHEERMEAARNRARWELGDGTWAGKIVGAYLWPEADAEALAREEN